MLSPVVSCVAYESKDIRLGWTWLTGCSIIYFPTDGCEVAFVNSGSADESGANLSFLVSSTRVGRNFGVLSGWHEF